MVEVTCTRRLQFCAGHRVYKHESKCANLHGHNYVARFTAAASSLDGLGRVIDFSVLKERLGSWLERHWDHGLVLWVEDHDAVAAARMLGGKLYLLPSNPTAENMAVFLLEMSDNLLQGTGVRLTKVLLYETENCWAEAVRA